MLGGMTGYKQRGIIPRAIREMFRLVASRPDIAYKLSVSYLEIYNELYFGKLILRYNRFRSYHSHFFTYTSCWWYSDFHDRGTYLRSLSSFLSGADLLDSECKQLDDLAIRENDAGAVEVKGLTKAVVESEEAALNYLFQGETNRSIAEHDMNKGSSRSHCIFTIYVEARSRVQSSERVITAKLNLVDLAGSERVGKTGSTGAVLLEARYINKSLTFLEQVVVALGDKGRDHVPYRQSKLTNVLRDSLGGNCKTRLIANISAEGRNLEETVSTLRFATRMMRVSTKATVNEVIDPLALVQVLQKQVRDLKQELAMHDTLANRGAPVHYDPYTPEQQAEVAALVRAYVSGIVPEIDVESVRHMREIMTQFRSLVIQLQQQVANAHAQALPVSSSSSASTSLSSAASAHSSSSLLMGLPSSTLSSSSSTHHDSSSVVPNLMSLSAVLAEDDMSKASHLTSTSSTTKPSSQSTLTSLSSQQQQQPIQHMHQGSALSNNPTSGAYNNGSNSSGSTTAGTIGNQSGRPLGRGSGGTTSGNATSMTKQSKGSQPQESIPPPDDSQLATKSVPPPPPTNVGDADPYALDFHLGITSSEARPTNSVDMLALKQNTPRIGRSMLPGAVSNAISAPLTNPPLPTHSTSSQQHHQQQLQQQSIHYSRPQLLPSNRSPGTLSSISTTTSSTNLSALPNEEVAFNKYRSNEGRELDIVFETAKRDLLAKKNELSVATNEVNRMKKEIDLVSDKLKQMRLEREAATQSQFFQTLGDLSGRAQGNGGIAPVTVLHEAEYACLNDLKRLKQEYQTKYATRKVLLDEVTYLKQLTDKAKVALAQAFIEHYQQAYGSGYSNGIPSEGTSLPPMSNGEVDQLDYAEEFDRLEREKLLNESPESIQFYNAQKAVFGTTSASQLSTSSRTLGNAGSSIAAGYGGLKQGKSGHTARSRRLGNTGFV